MGPGHVVLPVFGASLVSFVGAGEGELEVFGLEFGKHRKTAVPLFRLGCHGLTSGVPPVWGASQKKPASSRADDVAHCAKCLG